MAIMIMEIILIIYSQRTNLFKHFNKDKIIDRNLVKYKQKEKKICVEN